MMRRFRYWLADLISGGEFAAYHRLNYEHLRLKEAALDCRLKMQREIDALKYDLSLANADADKFADAAFDTAMRCDGALARIAAEVKPTSNATVKRMGRIASEALK